MNVDRKMCAFCNTSLRAEAIMALNRLWLVTYLLYTCFINLTLNFYN